jgi:uncharacterized protein (DUF305 family)
MRLKKRLIMTLASLGIATTGVLAVPYFSALAESAPWRQGGTQSWQMPMQHWQMMPQMSASNEFEFLSLMIAHHQEAITTAQRVLQYSERPEMKAFAQNIIEVQSAEIEQMQAWLDQWYPGQESNLAYTPMMRDLSQLEGDDLDQAFLEDMIMHHMGAVIMSQRLVNHGWVEHKSVQPFAQNIANTQRQEIWQMRDWLQDWYGTARIPGARHCSWQ